MEHIHGNVTLHKLQSSFLGQREHIGVGIAVGVHAFNRDGGIGHIPVVRGFYGLRLLYGDLLHGFCGKAFRFLVQSALLHDFRVIAVNIRYERRGCFIDGLQRGAKLRQLLVFCPGRKIPKAVLAGLNAVIGTDGKGNAFRLYFLGGAGALRLFGERRMMKLLDRLFIAREVQTVLSEIKKSLLRQINGLCGNHRGRMIHHNALLNGHGHTGIIIGAAQVVAVQPLRELVAVDPSIGKQGGFIEQLDALIFLSDLVLVVELGVGDLMDGGADCLHLAHALADSDALIVQRKVAVHIRCHLLKDDGNRRGALQRLHEHLVILHIPGEVCRKLRKGLSGCLLYIEYHHRLVHGNLYRLFLHDGIPVFVLYGEMGIRVELFLLDLLFEGRRRDDLDAFFALHDVSAELVAPFVEARHMSSVGALHIDQHLIVDAVLVKAAHGGEILLVLVAFKELLDAGLYAVGDVFQSFLVCLLFRHIMLLSPACRSFSYLPNSSR